MITNRENAVQEKTRRILCYERIIGKTHLRLSVGSESEKTSQELYLRLGTNEERVRANAPGEASCEGSEAGKSSGSGA